MAILEHIVTFDTHGLQQIVRIYTRAVVLQTRMAGMIAENEKRRQNGEAPAHAEEAFEQAIQTCFPNLAEESK